MMDVEPPNTNTLADELIERTSSMLDAIASKPCIKTKKEKEVRQ